MTQQEAQQHDASWPWRPAGVLFDMDGVLTDNNAFHRQAWQETARDLLGLDLTPHDLDTKVDGGRNPEIIERLTGTVPDAELAQRFHDAKEGRYRALAHGVLREVAGLSAYLDALEARGLPVALVTSADSVNVDFGMAQLGVGARFRTRVLGHEVRRGKPHPEPFALGAQRLGLPPTACLAHEDAVNGVKSAAGAGCRVVALTTTAPAGALLNAGASLTAPDFTGWAAWLR